MIWNYLLNQHQGPMTRQRLLAIALLSLMLPMAIHGTDLQVVAADLVTFGATAMLGLYLIRWMFFQRTPVLMGALLITGIVIALAANLLYIQFASTPGSMGYLVLAVMSTMDGPALIMCGIAMLCAIRTRWLIATAFLLVGFVSMTKTNAYLSWVLEDPNRIAPAAGATMLGQAVVALIVPIVLLRCAAQVGSLIQSKRRTPAEA